MSILSGVIINIVPVCSWYEGKYSTNIITHEYMKIEICKNNNSFERMMRIFMHELGHHYWSYYVSNENKQKWIDMYNYPEYIMVNNWGIWIYKMDYNELFAENFSYYFLKNILNKDLFYLDYYINKKYEVFVENVILPLEIWK